MALSVGNMRAVERDGTGWKKSESVEGDEREGSSRAKEEIVTNRMEKPWPRATEVRHFPNPAVNLHFVLTPPSETFTATQYSTMHDSEASIPLIYL